MKLIGRLSKAADGEMNNGYAFVEFKSPEECEQAVQYCKRELFDGQHLDVLTLSSIQVNDYEEVMKNRLTADLQDQRYLKSTTESELKDIIKQLDEIAKKNPMQAQSVLEQNKGLLYALIEAECQLGMVTESVPGMDILLESEE